MITVVTSGANGMEGQSNCRTLEELLDSLDPNLFWRAHRSYLVNINRIKEVVPWFKSSYQLRMDDKKQTEIPVSRAQTKRLRELFGSELVRWPVCALATRPSLIVRLLQRPSSDC